MYDVIIVGMGPAGMSAGVYAKRSGLKTLILEKNTPGGLVNTTNIVDNYLGYDNISGPDLAYKMFMHTTNNGVEYKLEEVTKIKKEKYFIVTTNKSIYETKTLILAGGRQPKKIDVEDKLKDLHISRCSICDAPLYRNKDILVIGGGNSAFEESIYLSSFVNKLTIICKSNIKADKELVDEVNTKDNINILEGTYLIDVTKDNDKYIVKTNNSDIIVDGIFSYIGYTPSTEYLSNLNILEDNGYIVTNNTETSIPGLFACGDILKKDVYQIVTATSEGAIASLKAKKFIVEMEK